MTALTAMQSRALTLLRMQGNLHPSYADMDDLIRRLRTAPEPARRARGLQSRIVDVVDERGRLVDTAYVLHFNRWARVVRLHIFARDGQPARVETVRRDRVRLPERP
jgi:hypothetical protein